MTSVTTFREPISRSTAMAYGQEALRIGETGHYRLRSGEEIDLRADIEQAVRGTCAYSPADPWPQHGSSSYAMRVDVSNENTLSATRRLLAEGHRTVALNFASATSPGGGFLHGARAQEEYLARSSCLYECLRNSPMYGFHARQADPLYSDYVLYSPDVPVFRGDDGQLLANPYKVSIVTAAAVHASRLPSDRTSEIAPAMRRRIHKVLAICRAHGHDGVVLGAWGCGAFGNDGRTIASLFEEALGGAFSGAFQRVVFAIVDWSPDGRFIDPFARAFRDQPRFD